MKINMNSLRQLSIEKLSLVNIGLSDVFLFNIFIDLAKTLYKFYTGSSSNKSQVGVSRNSSKLVEESKIQDLGLSHKKQQLVDEEEVYCGREDIEIVMKSLGIPCQDEDGGKELGKLTANDLSNISEEETPMFDELQEAFDVFDENKDGFIDAEDLQRVLLALGFNEAVELDSCRKMIRAFDENNDDRIDFHEFLRFMENNDC